MSNEINIVYDMDDVLNNLNNEVYSTLGIPHLLNKQKRYIVTENTEILTKEQMEAILKLYGDKGLFERLKPVRGIERILNIEKLLPNKAFVHIHSTSFNADIIDVKRQFIKDNIPGFSNDRINLLLGKDKEAFKNADIVIEDSLENLLNYDDSTIKILKNKSYNQFNSYGIVKTDIIRVNDLIEAVDTIEHILTRRFMSNEGFKSR